MDTYYTIDEKYLQAVDELSSGETPKALQLLREIVENDPLYSRAHYQLGKLYYYYLKDYQAAGYHFKICTELEPSFPDVYYPYLCLVVFLNMGKLVSGLVPLALKTPGVCAACVYEQQGLFKERGKNWSEALAIYQKAFLEATDTQERDDLEEAVARVKAKMQQGGVYQYILTG